MSACALPAEPAKAQATTSMINASPVLPFRSFVRSAASFGHKESNVLTVCDLLRGGANREYALSLPPLVLHRTQRSKSLFRREIWRCREFDMRPYGVSFTYWKSPMPHRRRDKKPCLPERIRGARLTSYQNHHKGTGRNATGIYIARVDRFRLFSCLALHCNVRGNELQARQFGSSLHGANGDRPPPWRHRVDACPRVLPARHCPLRPKSK